MKIELKRISFNERLSEETNAFVADLWINGVKRGEVRNEGHGGCDDFSDDKARQELDAYGKTLPPEPQYGLTMNAELLVGDVLEKWIEARQEKKVQAQIKGWCKKKIVFRTKDTPEGQYRTLPMTWSPTLKPVLQARYPDLVEIVNERFT
jgi:hypothetical protein